MKQTSGRLYVVDLVRSVAILLVLASHYGMARLVTHASTLQDFITAPGWNLIAKNGTYGVTLFFLLSGFLITDRLIRSYTPTIETMSWQEFYSQRFGRLVPLLALVVIGGALIPYFWTSITPIKLLAFHQPTVSMGVLTSIITSTFNWYVIGSALDKVYPGYFWLIFWSLSVEEQFYFFYPLVLRRLRTSRQVLFSLGGVILLGIFSRGMAARINPSSFELSFYNSFSAFDQMALGAMLSFLCQRVVIRKRFWPEMLMGVGMAVLVWVYTQTHLESAVTRIYAPLALDIGLFVFLFGGLQCRWKAPRCFRLLCLPGQWSYGMYLLHVAILVLFWPWLSQQSVWNGFVFFAACTTGIAGLSFYFYERPVNTWLRCRLQPTTSPEN